MFRRFTRFIKLALPFSLALATNQLCNPFLSMSTKLSQKYPQTKNIKIIDDIQQYVDSQTNPDKCVILCELHDDDFIDQQLVQLAKTFEEYAKDRISKQYEFLFVKGQKGQISEDSQNYFVIYTPKGQKIVNIDPYLSRNREQPGLLVNTKTLMKRLVETINGLREIRLTNISQEIATIENTSNYTSLLLVADQNENNQVEEQLSKFLKQNSIKSRSCQKIVVKDQTSKNILGLADKKSGVYLLAAVNNNIIPDYLSKLDTFKVGEQQCVLVPADSKIAQMFVFSPIQPTIPADQIVLNAYINRNSNTSQLENILMKQLGKQQYRKFNKALFYSDQVQNAALSLQMNDYTKVSLLAFDEKKPLQASKVRQILGNSFEWNYEINSPEQIDSQAIKKWIQNSQGDNKMNTQHFKSQKHKTTWSTTLTGCEYKQKRDQPCDKVIYHFSQHCHGCKKFGGKYELFAKNKHLFPGVNFYRINNDHNKAEGVRNYNSTPVFAYYKQGCTSPFIYRQPIFTEELFEDFIRITGSLTLMNYSQFYDGIAKRGQSQEQLKQLLNELK